MNAILVTTDLSPISKSGVKFAFQLAEQMNTKLIFYYVSEVTKPTSWSDKQYKSYKESNIKDKIESLKLFIKNVAGRKWHSLLSTSQFLIGLDLDIGKSIVTLAEDKKVKFICMSTNGASGLSRFIGTNTSYVVTKATIPMFVVPCKYEPKPIEQILFACDFTALKNELNVVKNFARKVGAEITVYHYGYGPSNSEHGQRVRAMALKIKSKLVQFRFKRVRMDSSFSLHLDSDVIDQDPSIITMFTLKSRNWLQRLMVPSETRQLSFRSKIPIMVFRKDLV